MADRKEVAKQVLEYIEAGINDDGLREKYGHAYQGLQSLFAELADAGFMGRSAQKCAAPSKRRIPARDVVKDIRRGANKSELMEKYALSPNGLQKVLQQLVDTKMVNVSELPRELLSFFRTEAPADIRREQRHCIDFDLPVWEAQYPHIKGQVLDITERGIGILGLPAAISEVKALVIYSDEFLEIEPFTMVAVCRWVKRAEDTGEYVSGFQVSKIHEEDLEELRKLIGLLTV
jgi:uncharacterized protein (DUF433 family)